jgi:hypothetical protein
METIKLDHVNKFVLAKHHLLEDTRIDDIVQIADDLCGLHSTELTTSYLSLFVRAKNFKKENLERKLYLDKSLARIRGMRRTLFIETLEFIPIIYAATSFIIERSFEKFMEFHKVSLKEYQEVSQKISRILKEGELSASDIRKNLNSTSNIPAIIQVMCNRGLLIRGKPIKNWKDRRNKYAIFKEYFPNVDLTKFDENTAIKKLVEKYIKTYGPVTDTDISWWTGLTKTQIKNALKSNESQYERVKISKLEKNYLMVKEDKDYLIDNPISGEDSLVLLPRLDPFPMGYKERERYINTKNYNKVFDRSGNITSTIFLDGIAIGVWDIEEKPEPVVKFHLFRSIENQLLEEIYSKSKAVGEFFFDKKVNIKKCDKMTPLTERTAGGFMTPLKNS